MPAEVLIPLRHPRYALLLGASLAVCFTAGLGCSVYDGYDDELLRRGDNGGSKRDADLSDGVTTSDDSAVVDTTASDASTVDVVATDIADGSGRTTADTSTPDSAADTGGTRPDADGAAPDNRPRDAGVTSDAADATFDTTIDARDADASAPRPDASDAAVLDTYAGDTARDGSSPPDATNDGGAPPPTFRVVRIGDGTTELSAASAAAFIEERRWDGQLVGSPLALPTAASGAQAPLTLSGIATSEGALALSLDGRYLALPGYATSPGRGSVASSTNVERVVARIDAAGAVDTTTRLGEAFSGTNARSAASVDGAAFWVGGAAGGVWYAALGGAGLTQIVSSPDNVRLVALFGDRLYGCSGTSPMATIFTVGNGRPTTGAQEVAALAGLPRSGMSPYAFAFFDRNPTVAGLDTLYLTDDRSPETDGTGGGIQKWTFDGTAWSRVATFIAVGDGRASFRGVTGIATSFGVALVASTAESSPNRLVIFVDEGSSSVTGTVIATAPANTIFRGVALSPQP